MGLTREQVIKRYGDPKSQIVAGKTLVMFYATEKLTLRDDKVTDVERISSEPVRRPMPVPTEPAPAPTPGATTPVPGAPSTAPGETPDAAAPAAPLVVTPQAAAPVAQPAPATPLEPKFEIKSVRPPSSSYNRPPAKQDKQASPRPPAVVATPPVAPVTTPASSMADKKASAAATTPPQPASPPTTSTPSAPTSLATLPPARRASVATTETETPVPEPPEAKAEDPAAAEKAAKLKKLNRVKARRRIAEAGEQDVPDIAEAFITTRTLVLIFLIGGGGVAYILWMVRQRQLLLAATAVSHSPFSTTSSVTGGGAVFNADLLTKLEWKRFEELVAEYYSKTGVVAARTKTGPASPVHIKISWKGEPRPFACVQCIAHPTGLVDAKPLQELVTVLMAEDIRRGYIVTTGKFNVTARDYAEEKHLTLLPGDIFLEKLNALPDTARSEIMQMVTAGDFMTPSCPKCETKMVKSVADPAMWTCPNHPEQVIPAWK